jgi:hypothetical protein
MDVLFIPRDVAKHIQSLPDLSFDVGIETAAKNITF